MTVFHLIKKETYFLLFNLQLFIRAIKAQIYTNFLLRYNLFFKWKKILFMTECSEWQYGQGCDNQCTCVVENTVDCDHVDGLCNCKPGYTGSDCESGILKKKNLYVSKLY